MAAQTSPRLAEEGEWIQLPMSNDQIVDTEDGGADILLEDAGKQAPTADDGDFYENLAEKLPEDYLDKLAIELYETIERDKQARTKSNEMYAEGLRRTGVGKDAPGGAEFQGASRAVHPMLTKAAVEYGARAMKEIFPATGPAKSAIVGTVNKQRVEKAKRLTRYFNWITTAPGQMIEFRNGLEKSLGQSCLAGEQFMRFRWSARLRRPASNTIHRDKLLLPEHADSFWTAERITFEDDITEMEFKNRIRDGIFRDIDLIPPSLPPDEGKAEQARARAEGKEQDAYNTDGVRRTYETNTFYDDLESQIPGSEFADLEMTLPYLIYLDESSKKIAGVYRNWEEGDEKYERMHWIVPFSFIPWVGAYAIGMVQCIGSLSGAATGAMRALLDAGFISNQNTSYVLKGPNVSGQSQQVKPTQMNYIKGGVGGDDIRKLLYPVPPAQPSPTLFTLLQFVTAEASDFVRTAFENLSENNPNAPVGTTYALIEQGLAVVASIIGRQHFSMMQVLNILFRIARMYMTDDDVRNEAGEILAYRADFQGPMDVIPVSDPGIPSDAHRTAQAQSVAQRADIKPQLYNLRRVEKLILERLRVPDPDSFLVPIAEPEEMNAANENTALVFGKPIVAFPHQDHLAHLKTHLEFALNPVLGSNPLFVPKVVPPLLDHFSQHMSLWYLGRVYGIVRQHVQGELSEYMEIQDDRVKAEIDRTIAMASTQVNREAQQYLQPFIQAIPQLQQLMQQFMPPQPMDPSQAQLQKTQMDNASREKIAQGNQQIANQKNQGDLQARMQDANMRLVDSREQRQADAADTSLQQQGETTRKVIGGKQDAQIAAYEQEQQNARTEMDNTTKERINLEDNQTALTISANEIRAGKHSRLSTGRGLSQEGRGISE